MARLTDTITEQHDQLVTITKETDSLYEYTHQNFRKLSEKLTELKCEHKKFNRIRILTRRTRIQVKALRRF